MATGYYLQDNPNPNFGQYGWPRNKVSGVIGVHTTESGVVFSGPDGGAENTARFIQRRTDPGGYHVLADADSRIKLVHPRYAAWADTTNNAHAMSVSGAMNAARWRDLSPERAAAITRNMGIAAAELVKDAIAAGLLSTPVPARRISPAEAISGSKAGFYGHGETNPGRRYDPGQNFNWDLFLASYASAVRGGVNYQSTTPQEDDEMSAEQIHDLKVFIQNDNERRHLATRDIVVTEANKQSVETRRQVLEALQLAIGQLGKVSQDQEDVTRQYLNDRIEETKAEIKELDAALENLKAEK